MDKELRLAVLIDAENISYKYIDIILSESNNLGNVIYKRIYGNWTATQMSSWKRTILDNAIQPIQQYNNTTGKNASDSALIIDAMDLLYQSQMDGFCLVASDSDYTRLATRLRESEKYVIGMGESKTPRSFISACHKFLYLDVLYADVHQESALPEKDEKFVEIEEAASTADEISETVAEPSTSNVKVTSGKDIETVKQTLQKIVDAKSNDDGWIFSGTLGGLLSKQFPDFDVRHFGHKKFVKFIESLDLFDSKTVSDDANESIKHYFFKAK